MLSVKTRPGERTPFCVSQKDAIQAGNMNPDARESIEKTGPTFVESAILRARAKSWEALELIASRISPGLTEEDGLRIANDTLAELGSSKKWHRTYVRFGRNTLRQYGSVSDTGVTLQKNDLFFVDIGPVWDGFEGDAGKTFVVGDDSEHLRCAADSQSIYEGVRDHWAAGCESGRALYDFAVARARERGWELNLEEANGHRLSDFPHALYFKGGISDLNFTPTACR